ncbi:hypothetical protein BJ742DRAFT_706565 [Cladochytrium replicatum]|nr:hypothetical protein BJ742DRAFT_706565 [Cladochytrium replicatum]
MASRVVSDIVQFEAWNSAVEPSFWTSLSQRKIDTLRLDDSFIDIEGYYHTGAFQQVYQRLPARLCLGSSAFDQTHPPHSFKAVGMLKNTNTAEEFKALDKAALFSECVGQLWEDITSGKAINEPHLLNRFLLISFADLKKYKFTYWFAFPALQPGAPHKLNKLSRIDDVYSREEISSLYDNYKSSGFGENGFFLAKFRANRVTLGKLSEWDNFWDGVPTTVSVGFSDPSGLPDAVGWPLRNFVALLALKWNVHRVAVICVREDLNKGIAGSIVLDMSISQFSGTPPKAVGWEKNAAEKLGPRVSDLAPLMDPTQLANTAVDLNLKLMRWRIMPELKLEKIASTKCLLLGAGTLGSFVSRILLSWGVRNITFVDNGVVSFSNPVRQPLYNFEDCLGGGKNKAEAAAESLKRIFPGVNATGCSFTIPMPGHAIADGPLQVRVEEDVKNLERLIEEHDAIFLLTDSRESRWLPTVIAYSRCKIVINAALGFDTYLVMRHGVLMDGRTPEARTNVGDVKLGCYYCNDVVAPGDSLKDRTLDQQCTVTRPGIAAIASSIAVELLVNILNHPDGILAAPPVDSSPSSSTPIPLGVVPHQVRGFLTHFSNLLVVGQQYDKCTACSAKVVDEYNKSGFSFLLNVFNDSSYLERLVGLSDLHREADLADVEWDDDDDL